MIKNLDLLEKQFNDLKTRSKPILYNVNDFKAFGKDLEKQFTGDIWNNGEYIWKIEAIAEIINYLKPQTIVEVGFNVGVSSSVFLNLTKEFNTKVYSMDINIDRAKKSIDSINKEFPGRFSITKGNSKNDLDSFLSENNLKVDLAFVDGGKDNYKSDCEIFQKYMNVGGAILIDDLWIPGVKSLIDKVNWSGYKCIDVPRYNRDAALYIKL
jgi:hypothetical protein